MALAVVYFDVRDSAGFEAGLRANVGSIVAATGYVSHQLRCGVEDPSRYLLTVEWDSVENHVQWQKAHATEFVGALTPRMSGGPDISHFEKVPSPD